MGNFDIGQVSLLFIGKIGMGQIILIIVLVLLLFGGRKIPELMKGLGKGMKEFKDATRDDEADKENKEKEEKK